MKRYAMEFVGTFFLTVAISLIVDPLAIGLILMAMIYVGGHISGAHFNPAISLVCFMQKRLNYIEMAKYVAAQLCGALLGLCFFYMLTNSNFTVNMIPDSPILIPLIIEALFVLLFAWVYLAMNVMNRYKDTALPGLVLGLTLCGIVFAGGLFNPAVACASILCGAFKGAESALAIGSVMIYIVGPLLGAFAASYMFDYFKAE